MCKNIAKFKCKIPALHWKQRASAMFFNGQGFEFKFIKIVLGKPQKKKFLH